MTGKSILLVNSSFYPNVGGVENSLQSLTKEFKKKGCSVTIVCNDLANSGEKLSLEEHFGDVEIRRYRYRPGIAQFFPALKLLKTIKNKRSYEKVICRSWQLLLVLYAAGFRNVIYIAPALNSLSSSPTITGDASIKRRIVYQVKSFQEKLALRLASKIIVFSRIMKEQVQRHVSSERVVVQPPGVDTERFYATSSEEKVELREWLDLPDKKLLLCLGRLEKVKGFNFAVEAMSFLDESYLLVFVGDGSQKANLQALVSARNLDDKVIFRNATSRPEDYYRAADFFLFTSVYESFGQVLLEATASGTKVVGFSPSTASGIMTAIEDIFSGYPSLVAYATEHNARSLAQAVERASESTTSHHRDQEERELVAFLSTHSWRELAEKVMK